MDIITTTPGGTDGMGKGIYNFLASVRLTIVLFLTLAVASIFGTIIQQGLPLERYETLYSPRMFSILEFFDLFDMYHSWWFISLLVLLAMNITACTIQRIPAIRRQIAREAHEADDSVFTDSRTRIAIHSDDPLPVLEERTISFLKAFGPPPWITRTAGKIYYYCEQWRWAKLGMPLVHLSVLLILGGALIGTIWGFTGSMTLIEGQESNVIFPSGDDDGMTLDFSVRCDRFTVDFYPSGMPRVFKTDVTILEKGKPMLSDSIQVNHPLFYHGLKFHQSTYELAAVKDFTIDARDQRTGETHRLTVLPMKKASLPGADASIAVGRFVPNFEGQGPAVLAVYIEPGTPHQIFWLPRNRPSQAGATGDFIFTFEDFDGLYYSGLQIRKDPGVNIVRVGFILIVVGVALSLMVNRRRMWVRIETGEGGSRITVAAQADRNRAAFEERIREKARKAGLA